MELSSESAEKIMNALSAFKTYKKPKTLPGKFGLGWSLTAQSELLRYVETVSLPNQLFHGQA